MCQAVLTDVAAGLSVTLTQAGYGVAAFAL